VDAAAAALVAEVRSGAGPRLLHAVTYRVKGHVSVDPAAYRDPVAHQAAIADDPIARARARLAELGVAVDALETVEREARAEIAAATAAAAAALPPPSQRAYSEIQDCGAGRWRS
jgi:pyruvate dehydrogenase E1 component alpha subunit